MIEISSCTYNIKSMNAFAFHIQIFFQIFVNIVINGLPYLAYADYPMKSIIGKNKHTMFVMHFCIKSRPSLHFLYYHLCCEAKLKGRVFKKKLPKIHLKLSEIIV